jgi:uncharacterized protein (TIGR03083 family)
MDLSTDQLLAIAFDAVTTGGADPSAGPADGALAAILGQGKPVRHAGWVGGGGAPDPLGAFITTAAELAHLLDTLSPADWDRATRIEGATVRHVVAHLIGVERYVLGCLGRRPRLDAPRRQDHWPVSTRAAGDTSAEAVDALTSMWWSEALDLMAACGELGPDHDVVYHHLAGTVRGLLVVRTFELWTHGDDIRQATGRPLDVLDEARLSLMVGELMRVLPLGLALSECVQPGRTARLNLTGVGGGSFHVALDPAIAIDGPGAEGAEPDITLTAAVIDLCRLAANRLGHRDLQVVVDGDRRLLEPILVGAAAFAAD